MIRPLSSLKPQETHWKLMKITWDPIVKLKQCDLISNLTLKLWNK